jgi:hypothetical protein
MMLSETRNKIRIHTIHMYKSTVQQYIFHTASGGRPKSHVSSNHSVVSRSDTSIPLFHRSFSEVSYCSVLDKLQFYRVKNIIFSWRCHCRGEKAGLVSQPLTYPVRGGGGVPSANTGPKFLWISAPSTLWRGGSIRKVHTY